MENPKKRNPWLTCLLIFVIFCILSLCCSGITLLSGYYLYSSGRLSVNNILNLVNLGPSEIQVVNLSDGDIEVTLLSIDKESGESSHIQSKTLMPFDIKTLRSISSGDYTIDVETYSNQPQGQICNIHIKGSSLYSIAVLPEGIIIAQDGKKVSSIDDVNMKTSTLCDN
jgi:hypothetical protein